MVAGFISERWPASNRNPGRLHVGTPGRFKSESASKYKKLVLAVALISHLAERQTGPISAVAVERAIKWAEFLEKHALRAYASANVINASAAHAILRAIWAGRLKTTFSVREVQRSNLLGLDTAESIKGALDLLVDCAWLIPAAPEGPPGRRGRPSERYTFSGHPKAARPSA